MTQHQRNGAGSQRQVPRQRATGTVRGSDLRLRPSRQTSVGWPLIVAGFAIGAVAVVWILSGKPSEQTVTGAVPTKSPAAAAATTSSAVTTTAAPGTLPTSLSPAPPTPPPTRTTAPPSPTVASSIRAETPEPTQPPSELAVLTIVFPSDGEVVRDAEFNVVGNGPPDATVTRDIPMWFDDHVTVRDDGNWLMPVSLGEGENTLRFRIGDDRSTERVIRVIYKPRS